MYVLPFRDDPDQQNLIDWIQEGWLQCCGIEGPTVSPVFNQIFWSSKFIIHLVQSNIGLLQRPNFRTGTRTSTSTAAAKQLAHVKPVASHSGFLSRQTLIVWTLTYLFSCCKPKDNELIKNKQCGYDVRKQDYVSTYHPRLFFKNKNPILF